MVLEIFSSAHKTSSLTDYYTFSVWWFMGFWLLCFIVMVLDIFPCSWNKWSFRLCFIVMVLDMCSAAHKRSGRTGITTQFPSGGSWVLALMFYCDGTKHLSLLIKQIRLCFIVMVLDIFPRLIKEVALLTLLHLIPTVVSSVSDFFVWKYIWVSHWDVPKHMKQILLGTTATNVVHGSDFMV